MSDDESVRRTLHRVIERVAAMNGESPRQMQRMGWAAAERAEKEAEQILRDSHANGCYDAFYRKRYMKECWDRREQSRAAPAAKRREDPGRSSGARLVLSLARPTAARIRAAPGRVAP